MNELTVFNGELGSIRTIEINSETYFVAKDIADILGYSDTQAMTKRLDEDDIETYTDISSGQGRIMTLINESGIYASILGSKKPKAKQFKKWVTSEVLPSIRKTGSYQVKPLDMIDSNMLMQIAIQMKQVEQERDEAIITKAYISDKKTATACGRNGGLTTQNNKLKIKLDESSKYSTIRKQTMITKNKYDFRLLTRVSKELGLEIKKAEDELYGEVNSYHKDVWLKCYDIKIS